MPHRSLSVGRLKCHVLEAGTVRLDGGAMFGIVPKVLWERRIPSDERNRIALAMRCLLIEHPDGLVLVDTGIGNKEDAKFRDIFGVDNAGADGRTMLEDELDRLGYKPDDVAYVVNTHMHFDHAGGNTYRDERGRIGPSFPRARYVVQSAELDFAIHTNERTAASYLPSTREGVDFVTIDGERELLPGIRCLPTLGHTAGHQSILVASGGETLCFLGDLVPTSAHLPFPWIMGFDSEPLRTLETRHRIYPRAAAEGWRLIFQHDPTVVMGRLVKEAKGFGLVEGTALD
jgi:glyoxylase-like metal-dependent hydrolase (beta-lactamase superfamily II)